MFFFIYFLLLTVLPIFYFFLCTPRKLWSNLCSISLWKSQSTKVEGNCNEIVEILRSQTQNQLHFEACPKYISHLQLIELHCLVSSTKHYNIVDASSRIEGAFLRELIILHERKVQDDCPSLQIATYVVTKNLLLKNLDLRVLTAPLVYAYK